MGSRKIGKEAVTLTIAKVVTMLIGLVSSMLLARFRTLEEYGTYAQITLVISLATSLFMLGLPNSINFFLGRSESKEERREFLSVYYTLSTCMCFLLGFVLIISVPLVVEYFNNENIKDFIYILALLPWTKIIISSISNVLVFYGKTNKLTLFNAINASIAVIAILIVRYFNWSFQIYMLLYLIGELFMMLWVYVIVSKMERPIRPTLNFRLIRDIFTFSIPIGLASLVGTLTLECDKLVIGKLFDTNTLAIYTNAARELPFTIIATSLTAVLLPRMAKKIKEKRIRDAIDLWKTTVELSFVLMAFMVTVLIVYAPQIMTILYSEKYLAGLSVFRMYSAVLILRITYFGMILNASGKTNFILYSSIITLVINVLLDIGLYFVMGMVGPAVATFISILIAQITQLKATCKLVNIPFIAIFPWKRLLFHTLINITWGVIVFTIFRVINIGVSNREIIYCVLSGIPIIALYILVEKKNVTTLWKLLNSRD